MYFISGSRILSTHSVKPRSLMNTRRIMLIEGDRPLAGASVRLSSIDQQLWTDAEGLLNLEEISGEIALEIEIDQKQIYKTVTIREDNQLQVINVSKSSDPLELIGSWRSLIGQRLGQRYDVDAILGQGGMGVVLRARDIALERTVAIKMLSVDGQNSPDAQRIFLAEAKSIAALAHPNLVAIHDITQLEGRAMIVFEHVEGRSLEELIDVGHVLSPLTVVALARQLTLAISYMHEHRLVHRDIKPANALLREDGRVKVIDFGLTRTLEDLDIRGTSVRGTPAYMAPEQLLNQGLSEATDIYQLGATLYELLTKHLPFEQEETMLTERLYALPSSPQKWEPQIPDALAALVLSCMAIEPLERPKAKVVLQQLNALYPPELVDEESLLALAQQRADDDVSKLTSAKTMSQMLPYQPAPHAANSAASSAPTFEPTSKSAKRRPLWLPIFAASMSLLVLGSAFAFWFAQRSDAPQQVAQTTQAPEPVVLKSSTIDALSSTPVVIPKRDAPVTPEAKEIEPQEEVNPEPPEVRLPPRPAPAPAPTRAVEPAKRAPSSAEAEPATPPTTAKAPERKQLPPAIALEAELEALTAPTSPAATTDKTAVSSAKTPTPTEEDMGVDPKKEDAKVKAAAAPDEPVKKVIRRRIIRQTVAPPRGF